MDETLASKVRRDSCPLRRSFIERDQESESPSPMVSLLRTKGAVGGKGGGLRISLLLTLIWVNARPPHTTSRVAAYWAELLGREDPRGEGARAVRDALHDLADRGYIQLRSEGPKTHISLLNEASPANKEGEPVPYTLPYGEDPYVPIPRAFWVDGLAGSLSGAGVAMYLCALAMTRNDDPEFFIAAAYFEDVYGISRSSRKRGLAELAERGVLTVRVEETQDSTTARRLRRNYYRISKKYRLPEPWVPADGDDDGATPHRGKPVGDVKEQLDAMMALVQSWSKKGKPERKARKKE